MTIHNDDDKILSHESLLLKQGLLELKWRWHTNLYTKIDNHIQLYMIVYFCTKLCVFTFTSFMI
jgi:hypothetical protein